MIIILVTVILITMVNTKLMNINIIFSVINTIYFTCLIDSCRVEASWKKKKNLQQWIMIIVGLVISMFMGSFSLNYTILHFSLF